MEIGICMGHPAKQERNISQADCFKQKRRKRQCCKSGNRYKNMIPVFCGSCLRKSALQTFFLNITILCGFRFLSAEPLFRKFVHIPECRKCDKKTCPGFEAPLCLESGKLQTGNPLSAYIEQGKQPAQMERVSTLSVFSQIKIDRCQEQRHPR